MRVRTWMRVAGCGMATSLSIAGCMPADDAIVGKGLSPSIIAAVTDPARSSRTQSETALAVGRASPAAFSAQVLMATYNDESDTESTIMYPPAERIVYTGASLLGWSYSTDNGSSWTKGGKLAPPTGWSVLWGDPAATTSAQQDEYGYPNAENLVFISNLAIPTSKWSGSWKGGFDVDNTPLGGACIARSIDGGKSFFFDESKEMQPCVTNNGHFYDGGSMASAPDGSIYAAFLDDVTGTIDVWRAPDGKTNFSMLAPPFPSFTRAANHRLVLHPRIRGMRDYGRKGIYAAAEDQFGNVWMVEGGMVFNTWVWTKPALVATGVSQQPDIAFKTALVRTADQFSFDVGPGHAGENDAVRLVYTSDDGNDQAVHIQVATCRADLSSCSHPVPSGWSWPPTSGAGSGDQFNPNIAYSPALDEWQMTFYSQEKSLLGDNAVTLLGARLLGYGAAKSLKIAMLTGAQTPCPDGRGYWGDYDDMAYIGLDPETKAGTFLRLISDSTGTACTRDKFTSSPLHVTSVKFF